MRKSLFVITLFLSMHLYAVTTSIIPVLDFNTSMYLECGFARSPVSAENIGNIERLPNGQYEIGTKSTSASVIVPDTSASMYLYWNTVAISPVNVYLQVNGPLVSNGNTIPLSISTSAVTAGDDGQKVLVTTLAPSAQLSSNIGSERLNVHVGNDGDNYWAWPAGRYSSSITVMLEVVS